MDNDVKNLIFLGPQGSGKGTQAVFLVEKFGYKLIGAGDCLREIASQDTDLGRKVDEIMNKKGELVPAETISKVIEEKLSELPNDQKIILDSYPRTQQQYALFKDFWSLLERGDFQVIYIQLSDEEAVRRLSTRFICKNCGEIFIGSRDNCEKCGGEVIQREDDKPEQVRKRLSWSRSELDPMVAEMEKDGKVIKIDGEQEIEGVHKQILEKLNLS